MKKIASIKQIEDLTELPKEVKNELLRIVNILNENYGEERDIDADLGGYIILIDSKDAFQEVKHEIYLDLEHSVIPEFVDLIKCQNGQTYTNTLILSNNDFSITLIMPLEITPSILKNFIFD